MPQLTWKQFKEEVEQKVKEVGLDPETVKVRWIDVSGYGKQTGIVVRRGTDDDRTPDNSIRVFS